jgi:hypothetical protein
MRDLDVFAVSGRKDNAYCGFPNSLIEEELGVAATSRNLSTIRRIAGPEER